MNGVACVIRTANGDGDVEKLFHLQVKMLMANGCSREIVSKLLGAKKDVLKMSVAVPAKKGNISFVPVLPPSVIGGFHQMVALVRCDGKVCRSNLNPNEIRDIVRTPAGSYYMFDVENGVSTLGMKPADANEYIKKVKRLRVTAAETVGLAACTDVLRQQFLYALGSRSNCGNVPLLWKDIQGPKMVSVFLGGSAHRQWGSPSCKFRMAI